jgi:acetoacetate decarboxylase
MVRYSAAADEPEVAADPDGPKYWANNLVVLYETDPDVIAAVLPRPLEPTVPQVRVNFAQVDMPDGTPLSAGTFSVACRHGDVEGTYDLLMLMSTEGAVLGGRDTFGEPKKQGQASVQIEDGNVVAKMSRRDVDLVEVRGRIVEDLEPGPVSERFAFYFKFLLDPEGHGFDTDPALVHVRRTQTDRLCQRVEGEVILRESPFDPVVDLPVRRVLSITFTENHQTQTGQIVERVPSEWVWPFRHQRYDNHLTRQPA